MINYVDETHQYFYGETELKSVTTILKEMEVTPDYSTVNQEILNKAAARGELVHKEIENYFYTGDLGFTGIVDKVLEQFGDVYEIVASEYLVYEVQLRVAGRVDLLLRNKVSGKYCICDIKCTSELHRYAVTWQTNIYQWLDTDREYEKPKCLWIDSNNDVHFVELESIQDQVQPFLESYICCEKYQLKLLDTETSLSLIDASKAIKAIQEEAEKAAKRLEELENAFKEKMLALGIYEFENDDIKLTLTKDYQKGTLNKKKLYASEDFDKYVELTDGYGKLEYVVDGTKFGNAMKLKKNAALKAEYDKLVAPYTTYSQVKGKLTIEIK